MSPQAHEQEVKKSMYETTSPCYARLHASISKTWREGGRQGWTEYINTHVDTCVREYRNEAPLSGYFCVFRYPRGSTHVRPLSSTLIGKRPCSSANMSDGLHEWKAPLQMNRM